MKKNVLVFGLISGAIITTMMLITVSMCYAKADFTGNMFLGYAAMILAFSMIFVAVKNFRDKYNGGVVSFGKAFRIGLYVSLIASTIYVVVWLIDYYYFIPDFMDRYADHVLREAKRDGALPAELDKKAAEMATFKDLYKNPLLVILITYSEILPIGILVSLISAFCLKRKNRQPAVA